MNSEAWWRELPSGGIEVAAIDEGELRRHLVDDRGTMTLLEASPPTMLQRWGSKVAMAGWLIGLASILGFGLAAPAGRLAVVGGLVWAFAAGLFVAGGIADGRRSGLAYRLDARRGAAKAMWHPAPFLNGWTPATTAQLATVEELTDENDGVALIGDNGGRHVEVLVLHKRRLRRHWVDRSGNTGLISDTPAGLSSLSRAARRLPDAPGPWILIRTQPPPSD